MFDVVEVVGCRGVWVVNSNGNICWNKVVCWNKEYIYF